MSTGKGDLRGALQRGVKELREGLTEVLSEAEAASRIAVLKMEELQLEADRDRVLREIGRLTYDRVQGAPEGPLVLDAELRAYLDEARRIHDSMDAKRQERDAVRARQGWTGRGGSGGGSAPPPTGADEAARGGGSATPP